MTIKELQNLKAEALEENAKIYELKSAENRTMTETEEATVAMNNQRMKEFDLELETETRKLSAGHFVGPLIKIGKEEDKFSLIKSVRAQLNHKEMPASTRDLTIAGKQQFVESGNTATGDIVIPNYEQRANILAQTATAGMEIVAEDKKAILPPLMPRMVLAKAGATYMSGLVGNVSIPSYAGTTVAWKDEVEAAADGGGAFSEVVFAPKRLTAYVNVSKTFLAQDGVGAEALLLSNIADAVAHKLEATILGPATLSSKAPSGIGYKLHVSNGGGVAVLTTTGVTYPAMVGLETTVDVANSLDGNLSYIMNGTARGLLKIKDIGTSNDTGDFILTKENTMNGYPVYVTNAIPSTYGAGGDGNAIFFGNWRDLCIAQWGGYDITIDPYTAAKTNQIVIVINCYFDAKGLRGFTGTGSTLDEYAISFAALSIK
jgi:HK97 family phage major capsid protein